MVKSKDGAIRIVKEFLNKIRLKHRIQSAYIFGSYIRGNPKEYSDIDLVIVLDKISKSNTLYDESFEIFHEAQKFDSIIEVLCIEKKEFDSNSEFIISQIKKNSIRVF